MGSECAKTGFSFEWKIHNFSYCWQKSGDYLQSPEFSVDMGQQTKFKLCLYPRGYRKADFVGILIRRVSDTRVEGHLELSGQFSVLSGNLITRTVKFRYFVNENPIVGHSNFLKRNDLFNVDRASLLPEDILTVRCSVWSVDGRDMKSVKYFARTIIKVEQATFIWPVTDFSSLEPNRKIPFTVRSVSDALLATFYLMVEGDCCYEKIWITFELSDDKNIKFFTMESVIVNEAYEEIEGTQQEYHFHNVIRAKYSLPVTKGKLMENNTYYLVKDVLSLKFKCAFSTGIGYEEIERIDLSAIFPSENRNRKRKLPEASYTLTDDVKSLYGVEFLSDMKLRSSTNTFPVHKILLSARSAVFSRMFATNLRENKTNCVDITDMDSDTLRRLLLYIYTDSLEDLEVKTASQLFEAADKYWIPSLKDKCSSFLKDNLDPSNACDVLVLADMHSDENLKLAVQAYILQHECVFRSIEWKNLISIKPMLTAETMALKFSKM